jgi:hypothetical protein
LKISCKKILPLSKKFLTLAEGFYFFLPHKILSGAFWSLNSFSFRVLGSKPGLSTLNSYSEA